MRLKDKGVECPANCGWRNVQQLRSSNTTQAQMSNDIKWNKPSVDRFKCNIDAFFSNNKVRIGVYIIDDGRLFDVAQSEWFSPSTEVDVGEALGLLTSIKWVHELGLDCVNIQQPNDLDFGGITRECKCLLALLFRNSHVKFVKRQANEVAHVLT
ncbi:uncharacterized protein LOC127087975 [Lathyrus oleraceus]|uniref:uncharacterized protein LOC127087975 n=1 Tax=Pisum sativum TaxID=3888 RepID=UPI0021D0BFBB|nr:uncharacterized protein LOC127087975 [Pisum sativum]